MSWGYGKENGPANWYKDCPIAVNGRRQSPIDLIDPEVKRDSSLKLLKASYPPFPKSKILNNGHTAQFSPDASSNLSELSGGPLAKKYKFEQFHFHWGDKDSEGSEHRVNGKMYSAELHLVHWDCETHSSFKAAVGGGNPNDLSVLGFFLKVGAENAALKPITDMLSKVKKAGSSEALPGEFNMRAVLPKGNLSCPDWKSDLADYYTYDGSLTTPPLLECVKWIVFKEPLEVSAAQMQALRSVENGQGQPLVGNYRPPCPLHSRTVAASFK